MSTVTLRYVVPVIVEVDLEAGEVVSVNVADDLVKFDGSNSNEQEIKARQLAEEAAWPAWRFGF